LTDFSIFSIILHGYRYIFSTTSAELKYSSLICRNKIFKYLTAVLCYYFKYSNKTILNILFLNKIWLNFDICFHFSKVSNQKPHRTKSFPTYKNLASKFNVLPNFETACYYFVRRNAQLYENRSQSISCTENKDLANMIMRLLELCK
jgi:hypothetical protein